MSTTINGTTGITFNDASTQNTAATGFGFKNRILNGQMVLDQRNAGASVTPANLQYGVDRWQGNLTAASKFSMQQSSTAPAGFTNSLLVTSLSSYSVGSGDLFAVMQTIEGFNVADLGWGTADAQTITLSFKVRSSLTGTFGGSVSNYANDRSYPFTYTISSANTWTTISVTIAGDTTGTWLKTNSGGMTIRFGLGAGSTYSGTAGSWAGTLYTQPTGATSVVGTNGATFYITGVQLEKGSTATSFDYRPYGTELQLCQRYFQRLGGGVSGVCNDTNAFSGTVVFPVLMRTAPSSSVSAAYRVSDITTSAYVQSSGNVTNNLVTADSGFFIFANFSGMTVGRFAIGANNSSGFLLLSAEL